MGAGPSQISSYHYDDIGIEYQISTDLLIQGDIIRAVQEPTGFMIPIHYYNGCHEPHVLIRRRDNTLATYVPYERLLEIINCLTHREYTIQKNGNFCIFEFEPTTHDDLNIYPVLSAN